jgi:hypothetical protein
MTEAPILAALDALPGAKVRGAERSARCPAHGDRVSSLTWTVGQDGRVLVRCHAGCTADAIAAAMGMTARDLFPPRGELARVVRVTPYEVRDADGTLRAVHERTDLSDGSKRIVWRQPDGTAGLNGTPVSALPLWGTERARDWPAGSVVVCEGEKAAAAVMRAGKPALATFGADHRPDAAALAVLRGRDVICWPDADEPGRRHMMDVARRLDGIAASVRWVEPPAGAPKGHDAADELGVAEDARAALTEVAGRIGPVPDGPTLTGTGIDAADLLAMDLAPLRMVVPGLLPEGTAVLVAPPKVGKSCLVYQLAVEVSLGGELLGERVASGSALYFALEDGLRRGQDRLRAALGGRTLPRGRLEVRWSAPRIGEGLEGQIAAWLDAHPDAAMVAIDTLGRVKPRGRERSNAYDLDVDLIGRLQSLFRDRPVALVLVHHVNKAGHDDFVAQVSGTYGVGGSVDTIINVSRKRAEAFGTIAVTGRDIADGLLSVRFADMTWSLAPEALAEGTFQRAEVYRAVERLGPAFAKRIADDLGLERTTVQHMIGKLVDAGAVQRTASGYLVPPSIPIHSFHSRSEESEGVQREDWQDYGPSAWEAT